MAKMSRVSLARKKELEKPDMVLEFLQRASLWVSRNKKQTAIAAATFFTAVIVVTGSVYFSSRAEKKAFDRLTKIMPVNFHVSPTDVGRTEEYRLLNETYDDTVAGKIAGLKYADACYQSGDYEQAIAAYQKALSGFEKTPFFRITALYGLGYACEASGDYNQGVAAFNQILEDPGAAMKDEALFHLGRLYELSGDLKGSREMFGRILTDHPDSLYAEIVREHAG